MTSLPHLMFTFSSNNDKQKCIPVAGVLPICWPCPVVSHISLRGLPTPPPMQTPWRQPPGCRPPPMQTPLEADPPNSCDLWCMLESHPPPHTVWCTHSHTFSVILFQAERFSSKSEQLIYRRALCPCFQIYQIQCYQITWIFNSRINWNYLFT